MIPVLNEVDALPRLIEDMRDLPAEIVLVDGGSDDGSRELLAASGLRWIEAPRGRARQMNAGAAVTTGDILMFLHADTRLPQGALTEVRVAVDSGAVGGGFRLRLESDNPVLGLVGRMITWRSRVTGVATGDQALFATRAAFERLGGYARLELFEDIDFSRRLRRLGPVIQLRSAAVTSARRWERRGALRTIVSMWILRTLYYLGVDPDTLARHYEAAR